MIAQPPYALAATFFPLRALASLAGRLPIGGEREVAMAAFVAARVVGAAVGSDALSAATRRTRASRLRSWVGTITVPAATRNAVVQLAEASAAGEREGMANALDRLASVVGGVLDSASRAELRQLSGRIRTG